jgi:acyl-CoA thioester hydrolase
MRGMPEDSKFVDTLVNVRYAETDRMGVVYYANYLVWFEVGRVAWCREQGFNYRDMESQDGCMLMVAEACCRYKAPARFDDDLVIRTAVVSATDKIIRFTYEVRDKVSARLLATGETAHVVVDLDHKLSRLPDRYRPYFSLPPKPAP